MNNHGHIPSSQRGRWTRPAGARLAVALLASGAMVAALLAGNSAAAAMPGPGGFDGEPVGGAPAAELAQAQKAGKQENGLRIDATSYAKDHGVGLGEAVARLAAQEEYAQLVERLADAHPGSFAGSDIDHGKDFGLRLYFTGDVAADAVERTVATAGLSRPSVRVDSSAKLTAAESVALVEAVEIPARLDGLVDALSYDAGSNTITLDVAAPAARADLTEELLATEVAQAAQAVDTAAPRIAVNSVDASASDGHSGGLHLSTCTSGFAVSVGGSQGITTAGHCGNSQQYSNYCCTTWWDIYFQSEARTATADVQWHTTNIGVYPRFIASSETTYRPVNGRVLRASQQGSYICHRGKTTGYSCGTVESNSVRLTYNNACPGTTCAATWVRTTGPSLRCFPGDSGGVIFNAYNAYGLYKGQSSSGTSAADCNHMFHMPIDYLSGIGATLLYD